jgi:hypothetical protein
LQKGSIIAPVKIAADAAEAAAREIMVMLAKAGRRTVINNSILNTFEKAEATAKTAVTAADTAANIVMKANEEVKAGIVNEETELTIANALTMSKEAEMAVKTAVEEIKKIPKGNVSNEFKRSAVIAAKKATEAAMNIWKGIYDKMYSILEVRGGRKHRKHTHRKRKHHKRYTARK